MPTSREKLTVAKIRVYLDHAGEWRWSAKARNGRTVASSGEGFVDHRYAVEAATDLFPDAELETE